MYHTNMKDEVHTLAGSTYGTIFKITTWGESHGKGIGVVIDGCPSGIPLCEDDIQKYLNRRKPGQSKFSTPRKEDDKVEILSGVFEGKTTGTPISLVVMNTSQRSGDYSEIASYYRPGHADYTFDMKYGFRDYRGGGRSSGRETIGRVAAGAVAAKVLEILGVEIHAYTRAIGDFVVTDEDFNMDDVFSNPLYMPSGKVADDAATYLEKVREESDSLGGIAECIATGVPAGIGEPVFEKLDANLSKALVSIGSVKAFEIGDGIKVAKMLGSENNDSFTTADGKITKSTNHAGGTLGGISDGSDIVLRAYIKPTPSIFKTQHTINKNTENIDINIKGRHDPIIIPRAVVVVEAMTAITILDMMLLNMSSNIENIKKIYC